MAEHRALIASIHAEAVEHRVRSANIRALTAEHRAAIASNRTLMALFREMIPVAFRERHLAARAAARPVERPPTGDRPRCGARCRDGHACVAPVVWLAGADAPRRRCRMHGGLSTGPRTAEGRVRSLVAIGQIGAALLRPPETLRTADWCAGCLAASRRCRGAAAWALARRPSLCIPDLERVVRWTRCPDHARVQLAALARYAGGPLPTVRILRPCP